MKLRRFNALGLQKFADYVRAGKRQAAPPPRELLEDATCTELFHDADLDEQIFESKFDMGLAVCAAVGTDGAKMLLAEHDVWPWLSLFYSESTMPVRKGEYFVGDAQRHLLGDKTAWSQYNHHHRHLVRGAVQAVAQFGQKARVLLGTPAEHSKLEEQLMSRKVGSGYAYSTSLMDVVNRLYWDGPNQKTKRGAKSTGKGSVVRLVQVLQQLDVTYDVASIDADRLFALLPAPEFRSVA